MIHVRVPVGRVGSVVAEPHSVARDPDRIRPSRHPYFALNKRSDMPWKIISIGTGDYYL